MSVEQVAVALGVFVMRSPNSTRAVSLADRSLDPKLKFISINLVSIIMLTLLAISDGRGIFADCSRRELHEEFEGVHADRAILDHVLIHSSCSRQNHSRYQIRFLVGCHNREVIIDPSGANGANVSDLTNSAVEFMIAVSPTTSLVQLRFAYRRNLIKIQEFV